MAGPTTWATQTARARSRPRTSTWSGIILVTPNFALTLSRAILDMKNQRDQLHKYQKRITVLTDREKEIAKECLARGDTRKAKLALRRKKYQESLLDKTDKQLHELEKLTNDVEFALVQKSVLLGLQQGTAVLKEIHKEMGGIENVEKLLGESEEARAYQQVGCLAFMPSDPSLGADESVPGNKRPPREQDVER